MVDQIVQQDASKRVASKLEAESELYATYTLERYNKAVSKFLASRKWRLLALLICAAAFGVLLPGGTPIQTTLDLAIFVLRLVWLIPVPLLVLYFLGIFSFGSEDFVLNPHTLTSRRDEVAGKRVIFTTITRGFNIGCVERTVGSVLYWTERVGNDYGLKFRHEAWIVTEQDAYENLKDRYDNLERRGAKILVIPGDYQPANRTRFKARALQYASDVRVREGLDSGNDWVYHQDEETSVGEDTLLGILDFILNSKGGRTFGAGIILYPILWQNNVLSAEELPRSGLYDFLYLQSMKQGSNTAAGYHGSHFLTRADVENKVGWDFGPTVLTEDGVFAEHVLHSSVKSMGILKGFAFEQPPLVAEDLLKQRRRWILGALSMIRRSDMSWRNKLPILSGLIVSFSLLPALTGFALGLLHFGSGQFLGLGLVLGFLCYSIFDVYAAGYNLNHPYLENPPQGAPALTKLALNCIIGLIADSFTPWYAVIRRTSRYEGIKKDPT